MAARVIFHVDINAYYASAELLKNSALIGQPIAFLQRFRQIVFAEIDPVTGNDGACRCGRAEQTQRRIDGQL